MITFTKSIPLDFIKSKVGHYLQLGGFGILDGFKYKSCKANCWKILAVDEQGNIRLRAYCRKKASILPFNKLNQAARLLSLKEFKNLKPF